ncbi:MAG: DUF2069 domain-containing protein [Pseudomonadales bacterium]|jgi:uncharacterized membrane protein
MMKYFTHPRVIVSFYLLLILTQIADTFSSELTASTQWIVALVRVAPLLLLFRALTNETPRLLIWLCFLLLGYFVGATLGSFSPSSTYWDFAALACCVILFNSAMFRARILAIAAQTESPNSKD